MGKTKITTKPADETKENSKETEVKAVANKSLRKKMTSGTLFIDATFNNTKVLFADKIGNALFWSSSGSLGFKGAKKGTPFAASKVGELIGEKVKVLGVKEADVVV